FTAFGGRELWLHSERNENLRRILRREEIRQIDGPFYASRGAKGGWSFWLADGSPYDMARPISGKPVSRLGAVYPGQWVSTAGLFEASRGGERGLWTVDYGRGAVELARPLPLEDGHLLRDWTPGRTWSFFIARHRALGIALWKTDGTKAGTMAVAAPFSGRNVPLRLAGALHGRLLLAISGGEPELWWSDGTKRGGLQPFTEIVPGPGAATVSAARVVNGRAFLVIDDGRQGRQLWTSDGTEAGTVPLTSFAPDPLRQIDVPILWKDGRWYFVADDGVHGRELWRTDGTPQGTQLLIDLCPGPCASDPRDLTTREYGSPSGVFFTASAMAGTGELRALWQTDGTATGTARLTPPGVEATTGIQYEGYFDSFFSARTAALGDELWITGGTPETTKLWADLGLLDDRGSHPTLLGAAGDRIYFQTRAPAVGYGLWKSDGTRGGTYRVPIPPDLRLGKSDSVGGLSLGEHLLVVGTTRAPESSDALWSTDGTAAGFSRLTPPGVAVDSVLVLGSGTRAAFSATDAEHGTELWVTEGTPASTHLIVDLVPGPDSAGADLASARLLRGQLVFRRSGANPELWLTDGTAEGTRRLVDADPLLAPLERSGGITSAESGGKLFFRGAAEAGGEIVLWVSDGTPAGTAPLRFADSTGSFGGFSTTTNHLYFTMIVEDPETGYDIRHLWTTDGTPAGTFQVSVPSLTPYDDRPPVPVGDRLAFVSNEDDTYWITDGTAEGTFQLLDSGGRGISSYSSQSIGFKNQLVLTANKEDSSEGEGACYVWNGAGATVQKLENLSCISFLPVRDRLYFSGFQPETGEELWVMEER